MKKFWPTLITAFWLAYAIGTVILVVFVQLTGMLSGKYLLPLTTIVFFLFSLTHAMWYLGRRNALLLFGIVFVVSLFFESFNLLTNGWFFGPLTYTHKLGIKLFELVPLLIPITWFTVGYLSLLIAESIVGSEQLTLNRIIKLALLAAIIMVAWDLGMDPMMVSKKYWIWKVNGYYFGIPLRNYLGWLIASFCFYSAYLAASKRWRPTSWGPMNRRMTLLPPLAYALMWLSTTIANLDLGLTGAGIVGFIAMGIFALYWLGNVYPVFLSLYQRQK
ncbi:MAG: carotenoid biosynthesis protein [Acidiferrobacterales bacterium]|nr:carotenoid biosynthesis protein [Acidiferrobacterales bacterium]